MEGSNPIIKLSNEETLTSTSPQTHAKAIRSQKTPNKNAIRTQRPKMNNKDRKVRIKNGQMQLEFGKGQGLFRNTALKQGVN